MTSQIQEYKSQILEEKLTVAVLLAMYEDDKPKPRTDVYDLVAGSVTTPMARVNKLVSAGLISEKIVRLKKANAKMIQLTPTGREVSKHLKEIDDILPDKIWKVLRATGVEEV